MRKRIATLLSVILAVAMLMSLTGCFESFLMLGTWQAEIDITEVMQNEMSDSDEDMAEYVTLTDLNIVYYMTFNYDGTYTMTVDEEQLQEMIDSIVDACMDGLKEYTEDELDAIGYTLQDLLDVYGYSSEEELWDEYEEDFAAAFSDIDVSELEGEGKYRIRGNKLYTYGADEDFNAITCVYDTFELSGSTLTLVEPSDKDSWGDEDGFFDDWDDLYPVVFTKVSE